MLSCNVVWIKLVDFKKLHFTTYTLTLGNYTSPVQKYLPIAFHLIFKIYVDH